MKCVFIILVMFFCASQWDFPVSAALLHYPPNPLRKPGGCYEAATGHLTAGQEISVQGQCTGASCSSDGTTTYASCIPIITDDPKCHKTETDLSKPYPDCCPQIVCSP